MSAEQTGAAANRTGGSQMSPKLSFTGRIAGFSFRHKWLVLGAWLVLIVAAGALSSGLGKLLTN
jgi:hypothetical protein